MKFPTRQALGPGRHIQDLEPERGAGRGGWESCFQGAPPRRPRDAQGRALGGRRSANLGKGPPRLRERLSGGCPCRSPPQGPRRARRRLLGSVHIVPACADRPHHPPEESSCPWSCRRAREPFILSQRNGKAASTARGLDVAYLSPSKKEKKLFLMPKEVSPGFYELSQPSWEFNSAGSFSKLPQMFCPRAYNHLQSRLRRERWDLNKPIARGTRKIKQKGCAAGEGQCCMILIFNRRNKSCCKVKRGPQIHQHTVGTRLFQRIFPVQGRWNGREKTVGTAVRKQHGP